MAFAVGATRTTDGSGFVDTKWAVMTEQPLDNADKVFNWLIFAMFLAAGFVAGAAAWAGATVVKAMEHKDRPVPPPMTTLTSPPNS